MITIGACSPPCSSSVMVRALVDSASPGRNDVDSLFSASVNFPGRFAPNEAKRTTSATARMTHFAVRPAGMVRSLAIGGDLLVRSGEVSGFVSEAAGRAPWGWPHLPHTDAGIARLRPPRRAAAAAGAPGDRTGPSARGPRAP